MFGVAWTHCAWTRVAWIHFVCPPFLQNASYGCGVVHRFEIQLMLLR